MAVWFDKEIVGGEVDGPVTRGLKKKATMVRTIHRSMDTKRGSCGGPIDSSSSVS